MKNIQRTKRVRSRNERRNAGGRRGIIAVLAAVLMVPLMGMVAFSVDYAFLLKKRTELQRAADAAALAGVRDLIPDLVGFQDLAKVRTAVRQYARLNLGDANFTVLDADIEIGRYDPTTVYSNFTLLDTGVFDAVQVTLRFDNTANSPVSLFFARALGVNNSDVTATSTAVLQKATLLYGGADVLPFAVHEDVWDSQDVGDSWSIYGDGRVEDEFGGAIPGNWGTVDIGQENNSTSDISDQIVTGLRQKDLDALYQAGRISTNTHIDSTYPWLSQGDTGLSSGLKHAVRAVHGLTKMVPIYDYVSGGGNNTEYRVVRWGVVQVVTSNWAGAKNTSVTIRKAFTYDNGSLRPQADLSNTSNVVDGAYSAPVLVQ